MFLGQRGRTVALAIGRPVPPEKAGRFKSDGDFTLFLRARTHVLKNRFGAGTAGAREDRRARKARAPRLSPIDPPVPAAVLEREVAALPESSVLARQEPFTVYLARAREIPGILREIGRLREVTFRAVGEGTGAPLDLDRFDPDYLHLFLWDARGSRIAGAYRLGPTDEILEGPGRRGIYTQTLFRFSPRFFERTGDALEMGRSFVAGDYQKQYQCLSLLWRGIGEYVSRNPRYRCLFGPVSISRDYRPFSKRLMVRFLRRNRMDRTLARFVHARSPYREGPVPGREAERIHRTVRDVEDADLLVSENELDGKGMPVLLRHYLRLNASLLSFNVDRAFSDVVDGLILVDLTKSDPRLLNRFLGREGARRFLDFHGIGAGASVPVPEAVSIPA
jgi:putative hemolysin